MILSPLIRGQKGEHKDIFGAIHKQGFVRARVDGEIVELNDPGGRPQLKKTFAHTIEAIVDRIVLKPEIRSRLADSVETALKLSPGTGDRHHRPAGRQHGLDQTFSEKFACPDHPHVSLCRTGAAALQLQLAPRRVPACHGLGTTCEFDPELIVPDDSLSLENGAIEAWRKTASG